MCVCVCVCVCVFFIVPNLHICLCVCANVHNAGLKESMRQAELNNWSLEPTQIADLCSSINQFFARTGVIQPQGAVQPPVCHGAMHSTKPSQHLNTGNTWLFDIFT